MLWRFFTIFIKWVILNTWRYYAKKRWFGIFLNLLNDDFQIVENDFFKRDGENFSQLLSNRAILKDIKNSLISKILYNIDVFENFEITYNRVFILGSLDYLRIVLCEENLSDCLKEDLFNVISCYMMYVEKFMPSATEPKNFFKI